MSGASDASFATTVSAARRFLRARSERRERELDVRCEAARRDAAAIVAMAVERYRPRRVYQWGSLLDRRRFSALSDIDIAVEGLGSAEAFFALARDAETLTRFSLDIVELERIDPLHAETIRREGKLVHEGS
jgi:predicted nucleotidyltransferase